MKAIISNLNKQIVLIKVNDGVLVNFNSYMEKELFIKTHKEGTYELYNNCANVDLYMIIDTGGTGFTITERAVTYETAQNIIKHYL